jgi:hypothetical protein
MFKFVKYMIAVALIVATSFLAQDIALAGGGFSASCNNLTFRGGPTTLGANCYNNTGTAVHTEVDLNDHITNNNGNLAWERDGGMDGSTKNCELIEVGSTYMVCDAARKDGSYNQSSIHLDDEIANYNGVLTVIDGF